MTAQFSSLPGLFEPGLWRQAGWFAVTYLTPRDASPTLGLVFRNWDVAAAIFTGWQHALGPTDTEDVVRVAIIERSRTAPHGGPDYHVHLSLDPGVVVETRRVVTEKEQAATVPGRYDAWLSVRGPTPLARFKDAYQRARRYLLVPGAIDRATRIELMSHLSIAKQRLVLRQAGDIAAVNDPDSGLGSR